jgi:hypothetical protein
MIGPKKLEDDLHFLMRVERGYLILPLYLSEGIQEYS